MSETIPGILPLSQVVSTFVQHKEELTKDLLKEPLAELAAAFYMTLTTLENVYNSPDKNWLKVRDSFLISFNKEIKKPKEMNTSVTSGIISLLQNPPTSILCVLNCGTGPLRFQYYKIENGIAVVLYEHKPTTAPSFSDLNIPELYQGKISSEELSAMLSKEFEEAKKHTNYGECTYYAVITGDIRAAYTKQPTGYPFKGQKNKQTMDNVVQEILQPLNILPWNGKCYFISQEEEGMCEIAAVKNLHSGLDNRLQVIISFGVGRGSCQWSHERLVVGNSDGMNRPKEMMGMSQIVGERFKNSEYVSMITSSIRPQALPVISLKSGTLIHFYKDAALQKLFAVPK